MMILIMISPHRKALLVLLAFTLSAGAFSFLHVRTAPNTWALYGKARRGKLSSLVDADDVAASTSLVTKSRSKKGSKQKKGKAGEEGSISPALAQWAESSSGSDSLTVSTDEKSENPAVTAAAFEVFDDKIATTSNTRKSKKKPSIREQAITRREEQVRPLVSKLLEVLESDQKTKEIDDILTPIRQLLTLPSATEQFRTLTAGSKAANNYRLAWVGSEDAVCHIGTSLHKVPLARLQEVFLELPGRNRVQLLEVIRIIGPFPNIKNTLQGGSAMAKSKAAIDDDGLLEWKITWESMTDGTGKELLAGKKENVKTVVLNVFLATERVLIAGVPGDKDGLERREALFENNGEKLLVFVKEDNLEQKLDSLRVG